MPGEAVGGGPGEWTPCLVAAEPPGVGSLRGSSGELPGAGRPRGSSGELPGAGRPRGSSGELPGAGRPHRWGKPWEMVARSSVWEKGAPSQLAQEEGAWLAGAAGGAWLAGAAGGAGPRAAVSRRPAGPCEEQRATFLPPGGRGSKSVSGQQTGRSLLLVLVAQLCGGMARPPGLARPPRSPEGRARGSG
jgi:hypothetical protein